MTTPLRVKEYVTVSALAPLILDSLVQEKLDQGWELYGEPRTLAHSGSLVLFVQTMVVYKTSVDLQTLESK